MVAVRSRPQAHRGRNAHPPTILLAFEQAELAADQTERQRLLTFVIVGGGERREMAGSIAEIAFQTIARTSGASIRAHPPSCCSRPVRACCPHCRPDLSDYAARALDRMGVDVRTSTRVTKCDARGVDLDGTHQRRRHNWAAGVVASPAARWLYAEHDRAGRVLVGPDLSLPGHARGVRRSANRAIRRERTPAPGMAPAANRWAIMSAGSSRRVAGSYSPRSATPSRRSCDVGRRAAVVKVKRVHLKGFSAGCSGASRNLLPDWAAPPLPGGVHLAVGLPHLPARRAAHHQVPPQDKS